MSKLFSLALILGAPLLVIAGIVYHIITKSFLFAFILQILTLVLSVIVWMFVPMQYFLFPFISLPTLIAVIMILIALLLFRKYKIRLSWEDISKRIFILVLPIMLLAGCNEKSANEIIVYLS